MPALPWIRLSALSMAMITLTVLLNHPAAADTAAVDPDKPLGILLFPSVVNAKSRPQPVLVPAPTPPPLGILLDNRAGGIAPARTVPNVPVSTTPMLSLPIAGYGGGIARPEASRERPLGILIAPPDGPTSDVGKVSTTTAAPKSPPRRPDSLPLWQTRHASVNRPLGTLLAPDPVLPMIGGLPPTSPASPDGTDFSRQPLEQPQNWQVTGQSPDRPLGTLMAPDQPLPPLATATTTGTSAGAAPSPETPQATSAATSSGKTPDKEANFTADEMTFDREAGVITARGNVEVHQGARSMRADTVTYNRNTGVIQARGNVVFTEPGGERIFGEFVEISGDLKDGIIRNIGVILADRSRLAGNGGQRTDGTVTEMSKAVYSPCELCQKDPSRPPLWQIKAVRVIHDQTNHTVEYRDAWIEFFGYPVFYTPYFRHPDPTVKRQSGFLFPTVGNSSDLGTTLQTPYYWNISPHEDATITPMVMTNAFPVMNGEYRKKMLRGDLELSGSLTRGETGANASKTEKGRLGMRGHVRSKGRFDINDTWRWGFDGNGTTDDTYLRRYGFDSPSSLNSRLFAEAFRGKSYFSANTYAFQGLEASDNQDTIPIVLPMLDFNHVSDRDRLGGTSSFDFNLLSMTRKQGTDTRRLSMRSRWQRPMVGPMGDITTVSLGLNTDLYHTNSLVRSNTTDYNGFAYRVIPQATLNWRLPFVKNSGSVSQTLEPIAAFAVSPYGGNSRKIPNEDSTELEFDDTNLFSANRFSGLDRVEGGPRVSYGMKWGAFGTSGGSTQIFVGQSWRPKKDDTFAAGSGLENNFSDIVARMDVKPGSFLDLSYRTRFAADSLAPNRNEVRVSSGVPAFNVSANYVFLARQQGSEFAGREELNYSVNSKVNRFWRTRFNGVRDMAANEFRSIGVDLIYEDECVTLTTTASRTFFEDRDVAPTDAITFRLLLKTLGEVKSGISQSQ